jgi:hypothetical protein
MRRRTYGRLLCLYPYDFRMRFAAEMTAAFAHVAAEQADRRRIDSLRFTLAEVTGLAFGIPAEWMAKWAGDADRRARTLPDLRMMRPAGVPRAVWFAAAGRPEEDACSSDTSR